MKWLQDNPLGMVLAGACGVFILIALLMAIIGSLPVSVDTSGEDAAISSNGESTAFARQVGELEDYRVVNEKPVFNESRTPVLDDEDPEDGEIAGEIEVKDAPDVRLTGVVITPGMKIASLTPADGNLETVMAHEGDSLTGDFVGWQVTTVNPRTVVLESRDGQSLELDLQVHDAKIQEPAKPAPAPISAAMKNAQALAGKSSDATGGDDDEPLSRAEQIRQRIAERRAELRQEQEAQQSQKAAQSGAGASATKATDYQSAIREMMKNKRKDQGGNDNKDG